MTGHFHAAASLNFECAAPISNNPGNPGWVGRMHFATEPNAVVAPVFQAKACG